MQTYEAKVNCWEWVSEKDCKHHYQVSLVLDTVDEGFRDRVLHMVQAALAGETVEVEKKASSIGFKQEENDDS